MSPVLPPVLPKILLDYFNADARRDSAAVAACFTPDGAVFDEGGVHRGHAAIAGWHADAAARYATRTVPHAIDTQGTQCTVHAEVSGTFPGSPLTMAFTFTLAGAQLAGLAITA